ncbi:MAG: WXG100 family type VII secretion target [Anaerolineae bacterium]|jgi:WXG100 family type VII secretion target|nr:WXG100 family type VII secretion target [Anaerolineae bacterium]
MADNTQVNYDILEGIEKRFENASSETTANISQFRQKVEELHGNGWVGQAADKFYAEMNDEILPAVQRLAEAYGTAAEVLKKIRETFSSAEEETQGYFNALGE